MDSPRNQCALRIRMQTFSRPIKIKMPRWNLARWLKNPAAISPVWLEKPERIAALAMLTVLGWLVYSVIQRWQVRLYLRTHDQRDPREQGMAPTAAVVLALFAQCRSPIRSR